MRVAVFGTRKLGYDGLKALIESHHEVVLVVTAAYEITEGYDRLAFSELCREHDIPFRFGETGYLPQLRKAEPDIGVSLYWRRLLGKGPVGVPKYGFLNVHAGDLPRYRGFASSIWQMLAGEKIAAVTIHEVVPDEADSGAILWKGRKRIEATTTIQELHDSLFGQAVEALPEVLDGIEEGSIYKGDQQSPMGNPEPLYSYPRLPQDGLIDWEQSAEQISLLIRAVGRPYPGAFTFIMGDGNADPAKQDEVSRLTIWKAHVLCPPRLFIGVPGHIVKNDKETGESWVLTGDGILVIEELQRDGKDSPEPAGKFFHSVQLRLGNPNPEMFMRLQERVTHLEGQVKTMVEIFQSGAGVL